MDNQAVGRRVWEAVGGQKNVKSLVHCATRLRFRLKDESLADTQKLKEDPDVIQVVPTPDRIKTPLPESDHIPDEQKIEEQRMKHYTGNEEKL